MQYVQQEYIMWHNNDEERIHLPVLPSSYELSIPGQNTTVDITSLGEVNLIGKTGLATITISSFYPRKWYYFCLPGKLLTPSEFVNTIKRWRATGKPIRLIITNTPINYAMVIENFTYGEDDATGDFNYTLELKEYRFIKTTTKQTTTTNNGTIISKPQNDTNRETKEASTSYTVKKGDTLFIIAKKMTGNGNNYKTIAEKNGIKDPNKISVGQVIQI